MTWKTNSVTFVECNYVSHAGDPVAKVETAYYITAREAMISYGWHYDDATKMHICPACVTLQSRRN